MTKDDLLVQHHRGVQGVLLNLRKQREEIEYYQRMLGAAKKRRAQLIVKLIHLGLTVRFIGQEAGISNPRVVQINQELAFRRSSRCAPL